MNTIEDLKKYGYSDEVIKRFQAKSEETGIPVEKIIIRCFSIWFESQNNKYTIISDQSKLLEELRNRNHNLRSNINSFVNQSKTQSKTICKLKGEKLELKKENTSLQKSNKCLKKKLEEIQNDLLDLNQSELLEFGKRIYNAFTNKDRKILNEHGLELKEAYDEAISIAEVSAELEDNLERVSLELNVAYDFMSVVRNQSPYNYAKWLNITRITS